MDTLTTAAHAAQVTTGWSAETPGGYVLFLIVALVAGVWQINMIRGGE
jgi:hypothetical protein